MTTIDRYLPSGLALFFRGWFEDPLAMGAVAPSGRRLSRLMARDIRPGTRVVELGPGTGNVTRAILERGVLVEDLALVERGTSFLQTLEATFPTATIVRGDATRRHVRLEPFIGSSDYVISGLPLVLFSNSDKRDLMERSFELLRPAGVMYQFTYSGRCPIGRQTLDELGLVAARVGIAVFNVPPAFVYRITRRPT
jgi:phosphatidylethanolamine/phosphatidyl-N-methylethanolamine N-methyltransferase